jgi:hypothetical protein
METYWKDYQGQDETFWYAATITEPQNVCPEMLIFFKGNTNGASMVPVTQH